MNRHFHLKGFLVILFVLFSNISLIVFRMPSAFGQAASPFLISPYFGNKPITSYYDHTLPNQTQNQNVQYFNGALGTTPGCDANFNRAYATTSGQCLYYDGHEGIDFGLAYEPVLAAASGTIAFRGWANGSNRAAGLGLYIQIQHVISVNGQPVSYFTNYGHLSAAAVSVGQAVQAGQIIGTSGNTGNSTAAHLHFGVVNQNNQNTDPFGWTPGSTDPSGANSTCLWKDGEWVNTQNCGGVNRPIPQPVDGQQTIQVADTTDNSGGFSKGSGGIFNNPCQNNCGGWTRNGSFYYTFVNGSAVDSWAKWQPSGIPSGGGIYEVYVWVPSTNATSWQVPYTILNAAGTEIGSAVVDQAGSGNRWLSIGAYYLTNGASVYTTDATGESGRQLAADDVMFVRRGTTYASELRCSNGWLSTIRIRSNGGVAKFVAKFMDSNGVALTTVVDTIAAHQAYIPVCLSANAVSLIVDASQDVAVSVSNERTSSPYSSGAYLGVNSAKTSNTVYLPLAARNLSTATGTTNSEILVQNTSSSSMNAQIQLFGATGTNHTKSISALPAGGLFTYNLINETALPNNWYGSAIVSVIGAGNLAATSNFRNVTDILQTYNGFPANNIATSWAIPLFTSRLANGLSTPISVQNISGGSINSGGLTLSCVKDPNSPAPANLNVSNTSAIPNNGAYYFNPVTDTANFPTGWYGACKVTASVNTVTYVQMRYVGGTTPSYAAAYEALRSNGTSKIISFPLIQKRVSANSIIRGTAVSVQNLNSGNVANVTFKYYGSSGYSNITVGPCAIPANASIIHNHRLTDPAPTNVPCPLSGTTMPDGWNGTLMVVSTDQPIDGFIQLTTITNLTGDTFMAHNAYLAP